VMPPPSSEAITDVRALIARAVAGHEAAYCELVDRYKGALYRLALDLLGRQADAEDVLQEAFIKAYTRLDSYDPSFSFYTWMSTIVSNLCYSSLRSRDWQISYLDNAVIQPGRAMPPEEQPEAAALMQSRDEAIRRAVELLPRMYREVLELRYWSDLTYKEVAEATNLSLGAAKTRIRRATLQLRQLLDGQRLDLAAEPL
jgi:RNA polymerase sigma-70 factor (ECF subfamily)